ncbi:alpha-(1,3)-fucosyltransferase C [Elysia marginata]|uniref:Fucosyltransferase n=1 Tax=Elysia marginata TaxID=1093978 RepID=A0AAV4J9G0_9GAST|nr:alpha-(1,3)-fucosyltransferase C [Elysia marginata]
MHIVPVVRGGVDYNREFPEKSLVNAANFKGPRELAAFLKSLETDELEYSRYLEVKDRYRAFVVDNRWCPVCEYLHKLYQLPENRRHKVVDLRKELYDGHVLTPPPIV